MTQQKAFALPMVYVFDKETAKKSLSHNYYYASPNIIQNKT